MVAPRVNWRGFLKIGELSCPVALYTGASTSERVAFHTVTRSTGNRVRREFIDPETEEPVSKEDQIKGYEIDDQNVVLLEPEEVAKAVPESNKTLAVGAFIQCSDIDTLYFDKPYYLAPSGPLANEAFAVVREAMREMKVAALAHAVLFRRYRGVMIRAQGPGLVAHTLNIDYEVRSAKEAFDEIPDLKIEGEMLDLAKHIIQTKAGEFDPSQFSDRYETALAELVRAKIQGREIARPKATPAAKVVNLLEALRASAGVSKPRTRRAAPGRKMAPPDRKAS
ncbi:Ku protein [Bosea sp. BK604]|uniref:non-homologous end joining protein Ku n=1 Tax=Bosea sp. BK604 TaxID=2512180 RepID=UPI0010529BEC|nr:Ku protein [Bosea sp. BK604]TCR68188.1 DNA end-binding protein Ku [Bosea sp. BK604]